MEEVVSSDEITDAERNEMCDRIDRLHRRHVVTKARFLVVYTPRDCEVIRDLLERTKDSPTLILEA